MTRITVYQSSEGEYRRLLCKGHSGFGWEGNDVVCAAVSVLVINTLNAMEKFAGVKMDQKEEDGLIDIHFLNSFNEKAEVLMNAMLLGLDDIKCQYGKKYLDVKFREV